MTQLIVPPGMLQAFKEGRGHQPFGDFDPEYQRGLRAAMRWLSENPIVPTLEQIGAMAGKHSELHYGWDSHWREHTRAWLVEWQRRMFLAPAEPETPHSFETPFGRVVVDPRVPPGEIRVHHWGGPTIVKGSHG